MGSVSPTVWDDVVAHIRLNHPELVRGWFVSLIPTLIEGGVLYVEACNQTQQRYLDQHCRPAFAEAAQAATGRLISVVFHTGDTEEVAEPEFAQPPFTYGEEIRLNPEYAFDHFVTGPCNRLAHAAAVAVANEPGKSYNPLFLHGPVGLGKTHLLQAICWRIQEQAVKLRSCFLSCEMFINHFITAVESGSLHQFRYRYRHVDVLVIDDIQFLAERERSQEEFFHTFNTLHQSQRQIILSADSSPGEIPSLEERLVSRFNSGLVTLMDRPCLETRMAIVRKKAKLRCIQVPEDVVHLIATRCDNNIRDLEGALIKIDALSHTDNGRISSELARKALGSEPGKPVRIPHILEAVARRFDVRVSDLQGRKRSKNIAHPRNLCMYLARQLTTQSLMEIGGYFGGRDHTTVLHASRSISKRTEADSVLRELLDDIAREVKNTAR